jgi:hypothetical protein
MAVEPSGGRGLSRRQMIKASAAAGAAAWTAPVIIDSLSSPAAAFSGSCQKYVVKLDTSGSTFNQCFGGTASICFTASDSKWGGTGSTTGSSSNCGNNNPTFCAGSDGSTHLPSTFGTVSVSGTMYYSVAFTGGCGFSNATDWNIGGRYQPGNPGSNFIRISTACASASGPTGGSDGCYHAATNTAWVRAFYSGNSGNALNYVYLKYCCPTGT